MTGLDDILLESILREDHAEAMTDNFDDVDMFINDDVVDDIIDTVMDDKDFEGEEEPSNKNVDGSMFSIYDTVDYK